MKQIKILLLFLIVNVSFSQTTKSQEFYEGNLDKLKIQLYLKISETGCPNTYAEVIYKYCSNENNNWLLTNVIISGDEKQFTMVEIYNTGILLLKKEKDFLKGFWISPDGNKKLKIELKKQLINKTKIEELETILEKEMYEANDC